MAIIISSNKKNAVRLDRSEFKNEDELQQYLADNPDVVPLNEIKDDIRLLILAREFSTGSGPIDAVGIDQDGSIYFIETKLYKNTDKREVVAQVLDYAASVWKSAVNFDDFMTRLDEKSRLLWRIGAQDKAKEFYDYEEEQLVQLFDQVRLNLSSANFKLFVLMDELEQRLKDLITFINQNSQFSLYAVELEFYRHNELEIIIPKLYGSEIKKDVTSTHGRAARNLSEEEFWSELNSSVSASQYKVYEQVFRKLISLASHIGFGGKSISLQYQQISDKNLLAIYTNGVVAINFGHLNDQQRQTLADLLKKHLPLIWNQPKFKDADLAKSYPSVTASQFEQHASKLLLAIEEFLTTP